MQISFTRTLVAATLLATTAGAAFAQAAAPSQAAGPPASGATICGLPVPPPANLPPAGSGPVIYQIAPCFQAQGNVPIVEPQTYLYYIQTRPSQPSQNIWV